MTSATRWLLTTVLAVLLLAPVPASAEAPLDVAGPVTDRAEALDADERARVEAALDDFYEETGRQLFVVYVRSFDGLTGAEWADRTAEESGLGTADILLAVSTAQRSYGYNADAEEFSDDELQQVDREWVLPSLRQDDWAGAAIGAAEGLAEVGGTDLPWGWIALAALAVVLVGALVVARVRRRFDHTHPVVDEHGEPVDPAALLTDEELEAAAAAALVEVDDDLTTSAQELGYAEAQFGAEATVAFRRTLERGRATAREAFMLRQSLDDAEPETDAEWRARCSRIITLCEQVEAALDDQVEAFDALRDLQARAPEALAAVDERIEAIRATVKPAADTWNRLREAHSGASVAPLADNVERATALLATAAAQAAQGRAALEKADPPAAAVHVRAAESAASQAATLLDALGTAETELARARDEADDLLGRVGSAVAAVGAYVETHRGAVGTTARTRLSEARRLLDTGASTLGSDAVGARTSLERAATLVEEARTAAEADVAQWRAEHDAPSRPSGRDAMLLGGILVEAMSRSRSPSYGGSSTSSHQRSPYRTPASFGGSRTRGRRSGGGRF